MNFNNIAKQIKETDYDQIAVDFKEPISNRLWNTLKP